MILVEGRKVWNLLKKKKTVLIAEPPCVVEGKDRTRPDSWESLNPSVRHLGCCASAPGDGIGVTELA